MASKIGKMLKNIGTYNYEPGAHMYHAVQGTSKQGPSITSKEKRHRVQKALHKLRSGTQTNEKKV